MSYNVLSDAKFRVVEDSENGHVLIQVGFGQHFRTFAAMKSGKLNQLRALAAEEANAAAAEPSQDS